MCSLEESPAGPVLDADLTTNRGDCMSHYGIAREIATLYRLPLKTIAPVISPVPSAREGSAARNPSSPPATRVEIECPHLCGRYVARVLRGVKVGPSPDWLKQ